MPNYHGRFLPYLRPWDSLILLHFVHLILLNTLHKEVHKLNILGLIIYL